MTDDDLITALRESFTEVHSATPVQRIVIRSRVVRARRRAASATAALAAAALAAGLLTAVRGPGPAEPNAAAAYVLERAARAVAPLRCPVPRPGQYIVVTSVNWWMTEDDPGSRHQLAWLTLNRRRVWQSADGLKPEERGSTTSESGACPGAARHPPRDSARPGLRCLPRDALARPRCAALRVPDRAAH